MTALVTQRGSLPLTEEDLIWLARAVHGEGGDPATVIWALASRWVFLRLYQGLDAYPTFTSFIRAYSQPVNPRWLRGGAFCQPGGRGHGTAACSTTRTRRRARIQAMPLDQIPYDDAAPVVEFFRGRLENVYPGVTDFRAFRNADDARRYASSRPRLVYAGFADGNGLFRNPATVGWGDLTIQVAEGRGLAPAPEREASPPPETPPSMPPTRTPPTPSRRPRQAGAGGAGGGVLFLLLAILAASQGKKRRT